MKIAKFHHSCLHVEEDGLSIIIDPGEYSKGFLDPNKLTKLDYMLITHEHQDHFDISLVKSLLAKFPQARMITTQSITNILGKEGITASTEGDANITTTPAPHEKIWMGNPVENREVTVLNKLSHPGDSLSFTRTAEILALPVSAPWGSTTWAVDVATKLKPKVIIPIHDWHWKDDVRRGMHQRLQAYFASIGIDFRPIDFGDIVEV